MCLMFLKMTDIERDYSLKSFHFRCRLPATYVPGFHDEGAVARMRYNTLGNTGLEVSVIGLGKPRIGCCIAKSLLDLVRLKIITQMNRAAFSDQLCLH